MKYIFFGSPRFATIILERLAEKKQAPLAIIASPDKIAGRRKEMTPPAIKAIATKYNIPLYQPEKLEGEEIHSLLRKADFAVVAAYAKIIPQNILNLPRLGTIGIHPSLLPRFRGASPIQSMILSGASEVGVTIYQMDEKVDHGPILSSTLLENYKPDEEDYNSLETKLAVLGANLFSEIGPRFLSESISAIIQDETKATFTTKFKTADAFIPEIELQKAVGGEDRLSAEKVLRKILAFSTEPGAWTILTEPIVDKRYTLPANRRIKLLRAKNIGNALYLTAFQVEGKSLSVLA